MLKLQKLHQNKQIILVLRKYMYLFQLFKRSIFSILALLFNYLSPEFNYVYP